MNNCPVPSIADSSDIANAVLDGTDCVMVSRNVIRGKYAIEAIQTMSQLCLEAEQTMNLERVFLDMKMKTVGKITVTESIV